MTVWLPSGWSAGRREAGADDDCASERHSRRQAPDHLIVDVGGVGYQVFVSLQTFYRLPERGRPVSLHIHTHVREDVLQLFGFLDEQEKAGFVLLKGVSGIGPRLAVNILSGIPVEDLEDALRAGDVTPFAGGSGRRATNGRASGR